MFRVQIGLGLEKGLGLGRRSKIYYYIRVRNIRILPRYETGGSTTHSNKCKIIKIIFKTYFKTRFAEILRKNIDKYIMNGESAKKISI